MLDLIPYIRHSDKPKDAADRCDSPDVQLDACRRYAAMIGGTLQEAESDPLTSGRLVPLDGRPGGKRLLARLSGPGKPGIVVQRLDRLFRDATDGGIWLKKWRKEGVSLHLANQGGCSVNTDTATGRMMLGLLLVFGEFEPDLTSERISEAFKWKQENGQKVSSKPPYGKKVDPEDPKQLIVNPVEQAGLLLMKLFAQGGMSLAKIGRQLEEEGYLCRGKPWHHQVIADILKREGVR